MAKKYEFSLELPMDLLPCKCGRLLDFGFIRATDEWHIMCAKCGKEASAGSMEETCKCWNKLVKRCRKKG